jgi:hypothetical protein
VSEIALQIYDGAVRRNRRESDWMSTKKWDIIEAMPDGYNWGDSEAMRSHFRILRLKNVRLDEWADWMKPMKIADVVIQKRLYYVNGDAEEAKWLRDALNLGYMIELDDEEQKKFLKLKKERPTPLVLNGYSNN